MGGHELKHFPSILVKATQDLASMLVAPVEGSGRRAIRWIHRLLALPPG